ncbi:MAG: TolC family protein [Muribaculaceae bacterium]|nr:TolC family protein [Muribaculaceae bacterium]
MTLITVSAMLAAGCAVAETPAAAPPVPDHWAWEPQHLQQAPEISDRWWQQFADPVLDSLVTLGMERNYNLEIAHRRSEMARAAVGEARSGWMPSVSLDAGWSRTRSSGALGKGATFKPEPSSAFNAGLSASWEIDIFGKVATGVKEKKAAYKATRAEYAGTMVSLAAQIASTYISLRLYQQQYAIAMAHSESQMKTVKIAEARFETTLASKLDVAQAWGTYYSTQASIPMLRNSIRKTINALALLVGEYPEAVDQWLSEPGRLPESREEVAMGVPADLLRRRPDIAQAEAELAVAAAQAGIAKKDFLPTLTLNGSIGTSARDLHNLFSSDSFTYSVAPTLSWTIFDGLGRKYALQSARENLEASAASYQLTVMTAIQEADNAISTYYSSIGQQQILQKVIEQNTEALTLALDRYKNSLSPMSDVITAQLNALASENDLVSAQATSLQALISLYEALGGGYNAD